MGVDEAVTQDFSNTTEFALKELRSSFNFNKKNERKTKTPFIIHHDYQVEDSSAPTSPVPEVKLVKSDTKYIRSDREQPIGLNPKDFLAVSVLC